MLPKKSELPKIWGGCSPPRPPGPYAYGNVIFIFYDKSDPRRDSQNEGRPWGLGRRYMPTSTGTLTRARDLLFARDDVARD